MNEYTPDQILFVENFTNKRDSLTLEVGLLTHEKEQLLSKNSELSSVNASLQANIDEMNNNASKLGFEQADRLAKLREEEEVLKKEIDSLQQQKDSMSKELTEKNNTLITLGVLIKSIQVTTQDTVQTIKNMSTDLTVHTNKFKESTKTVEQEISKIKSFTGELSNLIDKERKINYEKTKEIDAREIAVIGREKMVELKYSEVIKQLNK